MDDTAMQEVEQIMAAVVAGDEAAIFGLLDGFGDELRAAVRAVLRSRGARARDQEVDDVVIDLLLELAKLAPSWKPGEAPPWRWARHRVANVVDRHLGQWTRPLDDHEPADDADLGARGGSGGAEAADEDVLETIARVAAREPMVELLFEAVQLVASPRDVPIWFDVINEQAGGNRAPAAVVAGLHGLRPETVRQQHRRIRVRIRHLASTEPRFAPLADLPVVA